MKQLKNKLGSAGNKVRSMIPKKGGETPPPGRITNDTVAQHREQILSSARKFKYPMQHSKRRILVISIIISVAAFLLFAFFCWWQLYKTQSTSVFMHRVTAILPIPVAKVDGQWVRYSDYLTELRSSMHYLSTQEGANFKTEDGKRQLQDLKSRALNQTVQNALIKKYAKQSNVTVTDAEVDAQIQRIVNQQSYGGSTDVYKKVIKEYYDLTFNQWRDSIHQQLLRNKVYAAIDAGARDRANQAVAQLNAGVDFATVAKMSDDVARRDVGGEIGLLERGKADLAPELQDALFQLKTGEHSQIIESKQGLFILKAIEASENKVRAAAIFFQYTEFQKRFEELKKSGKIKTDIAVPLDPQVAQ